MESKPCRACGEPFRPRPQRPDQCFCARPACQRERKRRWQQERRQRDPDYRENDARGGRLWRQRHRDYWRAYRQANPDYRERNRAQQLERDRGRATRVLANGDVSTRDPPVRSGTYVLSPVVPGNLANGDVWTVEIRVVSAP
jgi:hypothetical protein